MERDKGKKGLIIAVVVVVLILILGFVFFGIRGLFKIFKWLMITLLILGIIGFLVWGVWYLFIRKERFDVTYVNKKKLINACNRGNTGVLKGLYLSGDRGHSRHFWGRITGICRISVLTKNMTMKKDEEGKPTSEPETIKDKNGNEVIQYVIGSEEQDVFSISTSKTWLGRLFEEDSVIRVSPSDHDELVGDVTLYGFSLIPLSEYWFLNNDYLDVRKIDYAILKESERGIMFEMLRDTKTIVDRASGLDTEHQKRIDEKSIFEVPVNSPVRPSK